MTISLKKSKKFTQRRICIAKKIYKQGGGLVILFNSPETLRNGDILNTYRHDSDFYYLTGFTEPSSCLIIMCDKKPRSFLFCKSKNIIKEVWDGERIDPKMAKKLFNFDESYSIDELENIIADLLSSSLIIYTQISCENKRNFFKLYDILNKKNNKYNCNSKVKTICDIKPFISEMRLIKDEYEIDVMRKAALISSKAHIQAMKHCRPGIHEYELDAELLYNFRKSGAQRLAYDNIVASGPNACVLHHKAGNRLINNNDLILVDAGCELDSYASDITRTFPAVGKFNYIQSKLYEIVLFAQRDVIQSIKPGIDISSLHKIAINSLVRGLLDEKIITGHLDDIVTTGKYTEYYMHQTSHWLGLDVHDVGSYTEPNTNSSRILKEGMIFTVEPGLYIRKNLDINEKFWNIGIRIEDSILVTKNGYEILTDKAPTDRREIEIIMKNK